jgi:hypothetical protein
MVSEGPYKGCKCHFEENWLILNRNCPIHGIKIRPELYKEEGANATE